MTTDFENVKAAIAADKTSFEAYQAKVNAFIQKLKDAVAAGQGSISPDQVAELVADGSALSTEIDTAASTDAS